MAIHIISETIAERTTGKRTKLNTDWPVENVVKRIRNHNGRVCGYQVLFGLCNGVPDSAKEYTTRREAMEAAGIRADGD